MSIWASKTTSEMAHALAHYYDGQYEWRNPTVYIRSSGGKYTEPKDHIVFPNKEAFDNAWSDLQSWGEMIYLSDAYDDYSVPTTYVKIRKMLVTPSTRTKRVFSKNPQTSYSLSVQTTSILRNTQIRRQHGMTKEQATKLQSIADAENKKTVEIIKLLLDILDDDADRKVYGAGEDAINIIKKHCKITGVDNHG